MKWPSFWAGYQGSCEIPMAIATECCSTTGKRFVFQRLSGTWSLPIITEGCLVGVKGDRSFEISPEGNLTATQIINLDSSETVTLPATKQEGKPGMQFKATPIATVTTSLAHPGADIEAEDKSAAAPSERVRSPGIRRKSHRRRVQAFAPCLVLPEFAS